MISNLTILLRLEIAAIAVLRFGDLSATYWKIPFGTADGEKEARRGRFEPNMTGVTPDQEIQPASLEPWTKQASHLWTSTSRPRPRAHTHLFSSN